MSRYSKKKVWQAKCPQCGQWISCAGVTFVAHMQWISRGGIVSGITCPSSNTRAESVTHKRKVR